MASSSDDQVAARGKSFGTSAEMVISCAAPARSSALRRHGQLGGAGPRTGLAGIAVLGAGEVGTDVFCVVITRSHLPPDIDADDYAITLLAVLQGGLLLALAQLERPGERCRDLDS
jgi:hypothetical protein